MSGIQLSSELVTDVRNALMSHDSATDNDMLMMQYLAAITGYVLAHQSNPAIDKKGLLNDLHLFMGQVVDQVERDLNQPPPQEAFGIWRPE